MKILFLDIDGVLNGHVRHENSFYNKISLDCMFNLNRILEETGCKIVVSSAWRYNIFSRRMTLEGLEHCLQTHGLSCVTLTDRHIIDITDSDEDTFVEEKDLSEYEIGLKKRAKQILKAIRIHKPTHWCAVDDLPLPLESNFVQTDGNIGLTFEDTERIIKWLTH